MPEKSQSQSLAVLIDADNTSARHAHAIFEEIVKLGEANVRRIYGDFSGTRLAGWNKQIQSLAILQHQQRSDTTGKNASDIALVIDAMDLMHKGNQRYHESIGNVTPADAYFGRHTAIIEKRKRIKKLTTQNRRLNHQRQAA